MRTGKAFGILTLLAACAAAAPAAASAQPRVTATVWTVHGRAASASAALNVLTLNDQRGIDNRISAYMASNGRLVLTAPEALGDPDGSGANCGLDNAKSGETSATEVSCAPGYIGAIVGDLAGGSDTFDADPGLTVMVGAVIEGQRRPLAAARARSNSSAGAGRPPLRRRRARFHRRGRWERPPARRLGLRQADRWGRPRRVPRRRRDGHGQELADWSARSHSVPPMLVMGSVASAYREGIVDTGRETAFLFFISFLVSFGFIRTSAHMIRAQVSWWPGNVSVGGTHIHHLVWGILLLLINGYVGVAIHPGDPWRTSSRSCSASARG